MYVVNDKHYLFSKIEVVLTFTFYAKAMSSVLKR